jgi:Antitoxin VbhA
MMAMDGSDVAKRALNARDVAAVKGSIRLEGLASSVELDEDATRVVAGDLSIDELVDRARRRVDGWRSIRTATQERAS